MMAESDRQTEEGVSAAVTGPAEILRAARKQRDISVDDVAHALNLSRDLVLALEAGDFDALGAPVFIRGHLRNYARLLELPEREIVAGYVATDPEPEEFRTLSMKTVVKPGASLSGFLLWLLLAFVLLIGTLYLMLGDDEARPQPDKSADFAASARVIPVERKTTVATANRQVVATKLAESEAIPNPVVATEVPATEPEVGQAGTVAGSAAPAAGLAEVATSPSAAVSAPPLPQAVPAPAAAAADAASSQVSLQLKFSAECWVEITDSRKRLLYGLEKPGSVIDLRGVPPFRLFVGNRTAVQLEIDGSPYTIPASARGGGNTARFTIREDDLR